MSSTSAKKSWTRTDKIVFLFIVALNLVALTSAVLVHVAADPDIEQKYHRAGADLKKIRRAVIGYYCRKHKPPAALEDLVPGDLPRLPTDPWGHAYILTSLAWRRKGGGIDLLSMGSDGKRGGKGLYCDSIARVDLDAIRCPAPRGD